MDLLFFSLVSIGVIIIPGPNVLAIISICISHGKVRGLQAVAGTSAAMALQLLVAALGTTYFISVLAQGFVWLKWAGAAYLIYLGVKHLVAAFRKEQKPPIITGSGSFQRGFWVSLTNPKTILFFSAFLPQFTIESSSFLEQIALLSVLFWCLAVLLDSAYAMLSSKLAALVQAQGLAKCQNGLSGIIYFSAGSLLAGAKNT